MALGGGLWHDICVFIFVMVWDRLKFGRSAPRMLSDVPRESESPVNGEGGAQINVLASRANWAWPAALREIFRPRGVNLLVAENAGEFVSIIRNKRIHTTILDMDSDDNSALATIRIIRMDYPLIPCILLSDTAGESLLGKALRLDVFSVIGKPVNMDILREQLNRLFIKRYGSDIFSS